MGEQVLPAGQPGEPVVEQKATHWLDGTARQVVPGRQSLALAQGSPKLLLPALAQVGPPNDQ